MTARPSHPLLAALGAALALAACGKSAKELPGCTTRDQCAATEVCQGGFCQADRAAPSVVSRTPDRDALNVWWDAPIVVTFDEPIDPATITDGSLQVTGPGGGSLARTASVAGNRLTVRLPQPPTDLGTVRLTVALSAQLRDPAGNALGAADSWGWEVPQWHEAAPGLTRSLDSTISFSHGTAPDGSVLLALQGSYSGLMKPELRRAVDGAWVDLGTVSRGSPLSPAGVALAVDAQGRPVLAYLERPSGRTLLYVSRLDAGGWTHFADAINDAATGNAANPKLALDAGGLPVVSWTNPSGTPVRGLFAARWTGTAWEALGSGLPSPAADVVAHAAGVSPAGVPTLAYAAGNALHLARFAGGLLRDAGPAAASDAADVALAFDGTGEVVAYALAGGGIEVARWTDGFGAGFTRLGAPLSAGVGAQVAVAWRPGGGVGRKLLAGFTDGAPRAFGWDGTSWSSVSDTIATPAKPLCCVAGPTLGGGPGGVVSAVWGETFGPFTPTFQVRRFNR